jgi:hypothetical protein
MRRSRYGTGSARFAGSTYDPTSYYRAAEVFGFFERQRLTDELLPEVGQHQVGVLLEGFESLDLDPAVVRVHDSVPLNERGGFLALQASGAEQLCVALKQRGVSPDFRGDVLRFGPAPYLSDLQLVSAMEALGEVVRAVPG